MPGVFILHARYPMGILLAQTRLPLTEKWISRFIAGGTIGAVILPLLVGLSLKDTPQAMSWAVALFIVLQLASYITVAAMKQLPT